MTHRLRNLSIGLWALVAFASPSGADVLHLVSGGRLEGVVTRETATTLTIDVGVGQVSVPRASVLRIERKESALSEYRARLAAIETGDVAAMADLARFASDNDLRSESRTLWARVASLDPRNVEAHLALGHVLIGGTYVDEDEAYRSRGFVHFNGRWMTQAEQASILREREERAAHERRASDERRAAWEAEDRERRAEAEAARARAATYVPFWGYGGYVGYGGYGGYRGGSSNWRGRGSSCYGAGCASTLPAWTQPQPPPMLPPTQRIPPVRPSSIH